MKNRLKILHVISGLGDGGAEGVLFRLCCNCKDHEHIVVSLSGMGKYGRLLNQHGISVHDLNLTSIFSLPFYFIKLIILIRGIAPNVVQTWMYHADLFGGLAAKLAGVKYVSWGVRMSLSDKDNVRASTRLVAKACGYLSRCIPDRIIFCARAAVEPHIKLGYSLDKTVVIPNGFDVQKLRPDLKQRDSFRSYFDLPENVFVIGMVARFDPLKDHINLLSALSIFRDEGYRFVCVLIGNGVDSRNFELESAISHFNLRQQVLLLGPRSDISLVMNGLDLHVLSSASEGFPNVLAEAMACGVPCVATRVGDVSDIIEDQELICSPRSSRALAGVIMMMYEEWAVLSPRWRKWQIDGPEIIGQKYSVSAMNAAYSECWKSLYNRGIR